ncbi:MAG: 3-deoxy-7-phosphoheptulonate synthase [Kiritimatiellae bacterium]|nr:3-deoxy-7-phosphoheptulonate synthase [Kiritimatiellia bacterium]
MRLPGIDNTNINDVLLLKTPAQIRDILPQTEVTTKMVAEGRASIERILDCIDNHFIVITGPCSLHNIEEAKEYASRLKVLSDKVSDKLLIVMRVYFEKPRSVLGWKGLINDPYLDDTFRMEEGIIIARKFLLDLAELGLPAATEILDTLTPQYIGDLISWSAIGARTAEAQTHREIASGISTPVGFKNATDGSLGAAINGVRASLGSHHFLGVTDEGLPAVFSTKGNRYAHVVLRGGKRPNYDEVSIIECEEALEAAHLPKRIIVDCSHGNSLKKPERQRIVVNSILSQIENGNTSICGYMLESNLEFGSQPITADKSKLRYGVSVTDACIGWAETEELIMETYERLKSARPM